MLRNVTERKYDIEYCSFVHCFLLKMNSSHNLLFKKLHRRKLRLMILYIYQMASNKAQRWHQSPGVGLSVHWGKNILVSSLDKTCNMLCNVFRQKQSLSIRNTQLVDFSFCLNPLLCLFCLATASMHLEPELIVMQNKFTVG